MARALNSRRKALNGARVLVLGVAYKANVDDMRESPSLQASSSSCGRTAPTWTTTTPTWSGCPARAMSSVPLDAASLAAHDVVVVVTAHDGIDWEMVAAESPLVVDLRNVVPDTDGKVWTL